MLKPSQLCPQRYRLSSVLHAGLLPEPSLPSLRPLRHDGDGEDLRLYCHYRPQVAEVVVIELDIRRKLACGCPHLRVAKC